MRILILLFKILIFFGVISGLVFVVVRESLVIMAANQVRQAAKDMVKAGSQHGQYLDRCLRGSDAGDGTVDRSELAFTSDRDYQVQVICSQFESEPLVLANQTLPAFVKREPGSAGLVFQDEMATVTLGLWGRYRTIELKGDEVSIRVGPAQVISSQQPLTACSGFGYSCCQLDSEAGLGDQQTRVTDCAKSCFTQCAPRPVILSLNTQPYFDGQSRQVTVTPGQSVTFSYVVENQATQVEVVQISYGDGQVETLPDMTGTFNHAFTCRQTACQYEVKLVARSTTGILSADTSISRVKVVVSNTSGGNFY